jgi:hypothetical protein
MLLVAFALVVVLAIGMTGSGAWFTSTATSTGNQLTAATLKLNVDGQESVVQSYVLPNIKPSDWALGGQAVLKNTGTIPGHLWFEIVNVSPAGTALGNLVYPKLQQNVAPWTRFGGTEVINSAVGHRVDVTDLAPGESLPIVAYFSWPPTDGDNAAQGQTVTFDIVWHLDQIP